MTRIPSRYEFLAPPHSFINVRDFPSPKELAEYLLYLNSNPSEYLSYFWWQDRYQIHIPDERQTRCGICKRLHRIKSRPPIEDVQGEWVDGKCEPEGKYPWSKYGTPAGYGDPYRAVLEDELERDWTKAWFWSNMDKLS